MHFQHTFLGQLSTPGVAWGYDDAAPLGRFLADTNNKSTAPLGFSCSKASASGLGTGQTVNPEAEASGGLPRKRGTLTGTPAKRLRDSTPVTLSFCCNCLIRSAIRVLSRFA